VLAGCSGGGESSTLQTELTSEDAAAQTPVFTEHAYTIEGVTAQLEKTPERADLIFQLMRLRMNETDYQGVLELLDPLDHTGDDLWRSQGHMLVGKVIKEKMAESAGPDLRDELLAKAARQFEIAIDIDPSPANLASYWYLGDLQYELGRVEEAIENLSVYLTLQPYAYDVRLRLAEIYLHEGYKDRTKLLLEGMKTDPNEQRRMKAEALMRSVSGGKSEHSDVALVILIFIFFGALLTVILKIKARSRMPRRPV
jgi:tetratricopeptide (TPR) repeat protein